jgi:hypothetical protein
MAGGPAQAGDAASGGAAVTATATAASTASAGERGRHRAARHSLWRGRAARVAAAGTVGVLAVTGVAAASAAASTPASASWRIVKRVHAGFGQFTAVAAAGRTGGWAFTGNPGKPTAWKRSGSTWTKESFPARSDETVAAAAASSASNVWAFTSNFSKSRALRWNGHHWSVARTFSGVVGGAVVLSSSDVWAFGQPFIPGSGLGAWHYNGHSWAHVTSGHGLQGGSGLSASDVWAFSGTSVARWTGHTWSRTSVKSLLPAKGSENLPAVVGIVADSRHNVYAIGTGGTPDDGGPTVVLHYNGHSWKKVAEGNYGLGTQPLQAASSDGHGGLWIPMPGGGGRLSYLLHYSGGHLSKAKLPVSSGKIGLVSVSLIPHTEQVLAAGSTYAYENPGEHVLAAILQYGG